MEHLDGWRTETKRMAELLDGADLASPAPVPACPDWDVADLAFHVGWVWDRFRRIAGPRLTARAQVKEIGQVERPGDSTALPAWFRDQAAALDEVLADLDPDEPVWNFTPRDHTGAWVHRRMHHEAVIHRHDLEEAVGDVTPIDDAVAVDGVGELLGSLSASGKRWAGERRARLQVTEGLSGRTWRLRLEPGERAALDDVTEGAADVILRGDGATLLLVVWRRRPPDAVRFTGDDVLADELLVAIGR